MKEIYMAVFARDDETAKFIHDKVFGYGTYEDIVYEYYDDFDNMNFTFDGGGVTPNIDALKWLNGKTLNTINKISLPYKNIKITVATLEDLIYMKESTINMYGGNIDVRPQDYIDINILKRLLENG